MSGAISFLQRSWSASGAAVEIVMEFLADQARDPKVSQQLYDSIRAGVVMLDLSEPTRAELVDLIVERLPSHVADMQNSEERDYLTRTFEKLYHCAREQQDYNRDPTQDTYYRIGPYQARYFHLDTLMSLVLRHLNKTDYVRIDVSDFTPEQRVLVRDSTYKLGNSRILIVGED